MNPNLKYKVTFILVVVVLCLYFVLGLPTFPTSLAQVKAHFANQIKLGLDLQGGTHLILQVQVQEAVAQETDQTIDRLTTAMRQKNIHYEEVRRVDDEHIVVRGVPNDAFTAFSDLLHEQFETNWTSGPAPGETGATLLSLRPTTKAAIEETTMTQTLETIE